jgi:hypothetical protein
MSVAPACWDGGNGDAPPEIRGSERLAWDQVAQSLQQLESLTFRLYVSGTPTTLPDSRCSRTPTASGYQCSAGLPPMSRGQHTLELTSILHGAESARSAPITINVSAATAQSSRPTASPDQTSGGGTPLAQQFVGLTDSTQAATTTLAGTVACVAVRAACYETRVVAAGLGEISSITPLPDGRLLIVEGGARVRVILNETLMPQAALVLEDVGARIVGVAVAVAPDAGVSSAVFIAWTEAVPGGTRVLNVTRYRELQGTLGQGATIVTGLPFPAAANGPLALDDAGLLYLALPALDDRPLAGAGLVLRFTRDGATPLENPQASPVLGYGYSRPTNLFFDSIRRRIWMVGEQRGWGNGLATLPTVVGAAAPWPLPPEPLLSRAGRGESLIPRLLIANEERLYELSFDADVPGAPPGPNRAHPELPGALGGSRPFGGTVRLRGHESRRIGAPTFDGALSPPSPARTIS